jgi:DNA invertase Pin-like site-specific DNA recombinase
MKQAIGYTRVSGKTQVTDGTGLDEQSAQIETWARTRGYAVSEWFTDPGVSGELPWQERPGMAALVERVSAGGLDAVIVHQLDRIGRGKSAIFEDFLSIVGSAVAVWSVVDGLLTSETSLDEFQNADKDMILGIKMQIVRNEKRKLVARMKLGKVRAAMQGRHVNGIYPYAKHPERPEEMAILTRMRQMRDVEHRSYDTIAATLNGEGVSPRSAARWTPWAVNKILNRGAK